MFSSFCKGFLAILFTFVYCFLLYVIFVKDFIASSELVVKCVWVGSKNDSDNRSFGAESETLFALGKTFKISNFLSSRKQGLNGIISGFRESIGNSFNAYFGNLFGLGSFCQIECDSIFN
jgi:hypothetical protein